MAMHIPLRRTAATITSSTTTTTFPSTRLPTSPATATTFVCSQCRHATLLRRPKRPYTFTQLITLSDGSTFLHRTTSPTPVYRTTRDSRNSLLWNPSDNKLLNVEEDEAGRLAAFRARFGRSWDANTPEADAGAAAGKDAAAATKTEEKQAGQDDAAAVAAKKQAQAQADQEEEDNLLDLISSFGQEDAQPASGKKKK